MVLSVVFWLSQRQWLQAGLTWEWKKLFLVGNFVCESLLSVKLPVLSCPFPGGCVYWGAFPSCLSLGEAVAAFLHWSFVCPTPGCAQLLWALGVSPCGSQQCCCAWLCLTQQLWGSCGGCPFFPASGSDLLTPDWWRLLLLLSCETTARCAAAMWLCLSTQTLISHLITPFRTTKQCWGSRFGCFWRTHR